MMGLLERLVKGSIFTSPTGSAYGFGSSSITGISITPTTALGMVAVFAAVKLIAEDVASLPLIVYRKAPDGTKERAEDHPTYAVLHDAANPEMTAMTFRETLTGHLLTWGNAYAEKVKNGTGQVIALWPLRPDKMNVTRDERTNARVYEYTLPTGEQKKLDSRRVFHIPAFGFDGLVGYSPITMARRALEVGAAAEEYAGRVFSNDARPGIVLSHPKALSDKARTNLETSWGEKHEGLTNAHRVAILEEGMGVTEVGIPPDDAQLLESRAWSVVEVARLFRLAPHKLSDLSRATYGNIEESNIDHVTSTLRPWCVRWEQQTKKDILDAVPGYYAEHLIAALMRGNMQARYAAYAVGRQWGWLSADDVRALENMNPLPNGAGEDYLAPLNMTPAELLGQAILDANATSSREEHPDDRPVP